MQLLGASILPWPVEPWVWDFPTAPVGLPVGGLIEFGNAWRWHHAHRRDTRLSDMRGT